MTISSDSPLLQIDSLSIHFSIERGLLRRKVGEVRAVDGVSLDIHPGETLGLVGESGCGKSTLGRTVVKLQSATGGEVLFDRESISEKIQTARDVQLIFQDPFSSLNPRMTIGEAIGEVLRQHQIVPAEKVAGRTAKLLQMVELSPEQAHRYPHEFSGGQRQRIGIARALAVEPRLIICDEVVSALDVSVQAQILNLLTKLQREKQLAYLFISHDLAVVRQIAHRIAVMYAGKIVELGETEKVADDPLHPYTQALMASARGEGVTLGEVANPADLPSGCHFHPRCSVAKDTAGETDSECATNYPKPIETDDGRWVACHLIPEVRTHA